MQVQHHLFDYPDDFTLESGRVLPGLRLHYTTKGSLTSRKNVVWVCHALTGSSDFSQWWEPLFSHGGPFASSHWMVICANIPGSCYGSTGPLSVNPLTGRPYYHDFPRLTIRDAARAFDLLRCALGIEHIHTLIGGSLGGQLALEWAIMQPRLFTHLIPIACNALHSPWGIAFNEAQRMAIAADASWKEAHEASGKEGMKAARAMAMLSYRNYHCYQVTQQGTWSDATFRATTYQRHQGEKLAARFDAFSYWVLTHMMDSHDVGRNRTGAEQALATIQARTLVIGIDSDILFPVHEQAFLAEHIPGARLEVIHSLYGHDGFLVEFRQLSQVLRHFYAQQKKQYLHEQTR